MDWEAKNNLIWKSFVFSNFAGAILFMTRTAAIAERVEHIHRPEQDAHIVRVCLKKSYLTKGRGTETLAEIDGIYSEMTGNT